MSLGRRRRHVLDTRGRIAVYSPTNRAALASFYNSYRVTFDQSPELLDTFPHQLTIENFVAPPL